MFITAKIESAALENESKPLADSINSIVAEANGMTDDVHAALDFVREKFRAMGFWTYRGGYHVALHFTDAGGAPLHDRAVLIN